MESNIGPWIAGAGLMVSIIGVAISLVILWYTRSHLKLSQREARRNPQLHIENIDWSDASNNGRIQEIARLQAKKSEWENMTDEQRESYAAPPSEGSLQFGRMYAARIEYMRASNMMLASYGGPVPDLILTFRLLNTGLRAARNVEGQIYFKQDTLEPVKIPGFDGKTDNGAGSGKRLHRGSDYRERMKFKPVDVPPLPAEEVITFNVALSKESSGGRCDAKIVFSNPDGDYVEKDVSIEV